MGRALATLAALLLAAQLHAAAPPLARMDLPPLPESARLLLPPLDAAKALAEDQPDWKPGLPLRYAISHAVDARATQPVAGHAGTWSMLPDGRMAWRLAIDAPGALAIDVGFQRFRLPHGAELWLVGEGSDNVAGPFTDADNPPGGGAFWTPRVGGERAQLQLLLPAAKRPFLELALAAVNQAYRDVTAPLALAKSGSCNIDVACPEGDGWEEEIRSVAHYTFQDGGSYVCTGQLAASTARSLDASQPLFLTASHCVDRAQVAQSMVFYWRYESPGCRAPGSVASRQPLPRNGNTAATQSGATLLATHTASDFTVVRLNAPVPAAAQAFWSGWDRTGSTPAGSVAIHHPAGHEKRISFNHDPLTKGQSCILNQDTGSTHWYVDDWEEGTTEGGSSGSGLWDPATHLLVGVLSGGQASCTVNSYDCYGRLDAAWNGGGSASSRMRDWLDRGNTGAATLAGGTGVPSCSVSLESAAFASPPTAGQVFTIRAQASGGSGGYTYAWDLDDDGIVDRSGPANSVEVSYPAQLSTQVRVSISSANCSGSASAALDVRGPRLAATAAAPQQLCGDGDASMEPGERWRLPVALRNNGGAAFSSTGRTLFVPAPRDPPAGSVALLETPAPALAALAAGASANLSVDLFIPADAQCGAPLAVDFLGAANATQSAPASTRVLDTTVGGGQPCSVASCSAQVPAVDARHGLFYQHARSGNGLLNFVYDQPGPEDVYGAVWYTARPDRSPQWYTVQGPHRANLGQAAIVRFSNLAAPGGFDPDGEQVGRAWIAQPARDDVVFAWRFDDGREGIELLHSAGVAFASPNRTQQWYALSDSGWGAGVESNQFADGSYNEFWATFVYDEAGDGRWVVGSSSQREGAVGLVAYQVHCPGCPRLSDALSRPQPAGSLSRRWPALDRGLLDTDILLPPPLSGSWLRDDLPIVPVGPVEQP